MEFHKNKWFKQPMSRNNKGFTIVEVMIVMPIIILVIGGLISAIIVMTGDVLANKEASYLQYSIQDALDRIEYDTKISAGFLATNNITIYDRQGYENNNSSPFENADNSNSGPNSTSLILNYYATTNNPADSTRNLVYSKGINNCGDLKQQDPPVMLNIVYFVKNNTLWRRVIAPENYLTISCETPWQQPSCYEVGSFCKAKDIKLVEGITEFSISYYKPPYTDTDILTNASDATKDIIIRNDDLHSNQNTAIKVKISATGKTAGRSYSESETVQAISPNNYFSSNE